MDQYRNTVNFEVDGEEMWASDLPHHPLQSGTPAPATSASAASAAGFGLTDQLPLPQDGLDHAAAAATLPSGSSHRGSGPSPPGGPGPPSAFLAQPPAPGGLTASQQHREYMKAKRRVPASQRKRTQVSCDACKTRRCKCIRLGTGGAGGSDDEANLPPCKLCTESGIRCVTTMPRKQRVYGSVENLDKRYRALEAIVSAVFPALNPRASAEELVIFGHGLGFKMPNFSESPEQAKANMAMSSITSPSSTTSDRGPYLGLGKVKLEHDYSILPPAYPIKTAPMAPQLLPRSLHEGGADSEDGCAGLLLDTTGRSHYIGPSGTLAFLGDVRKSVSRTLSLRGGPQAERWQGRGGRSGTERTIANKITGSLGGTAQHPGPSQVSPTQARRLASTGIRLLEGDEPCAFPNEHDIVSSDDPSYWQYHRPVSMIDLPPKEEAEAYIDAFFGHVHPNFILFHRSTFQRSYRELRRAWDANQQGVQDHELKELVVSTGWLLCLYMVFIFGSRSQAQTPTSLEFQRKWHAEVEKLPSLLSTATLPNVCGYSE
ncbi:hypothetical protein SLS62_002088 [Diatrype stigma]|uniref:Zn(2)-C6 fungal-type domain-containing protein n=1 Tax=Diatrype stigma TaxID=117547 RepID=A0AAN9UWZ5_9PEZI